MSLEQLKRNYAKTIAMLTASESPNLEAAIHEGAARISNRQRVESTNGFVDAESALLTLAESEDATVSGFAVRALHEMVRLSLV